MYLNKCISLSVVAFKTAGSKYAIQYADGTTATLCKTELEQVLSPAAAPIEERQRQHSTETSAKVSTETSVVMSLQ